MGNTILSPNMSLPVPIVSLDPGPDWAQNYNSCLSILDQHNHASGSGVQISQAGISLSAAATTFDSLSFNVSNAYNLRSVRFYPQSSPLGLAGDIGCLYESGVDLWYNDGSGNQIKITSGGSVNATSSGISSGTATASFSGGVLVVDANTNTPANIQCGSILLGNNVALSNYLTLSPPNAMGASYQLTLPSIPVATSFAQIDTSGNFSATIAVNNGITGSNIVSDVNLPGKAVQENGNNVVVSNTNATNSLAIVRGVVGSTGSVVSGEGFSVSSNGTGDWTISFSTSFGDVPAITVTVASGSFNLLPMIVSAAVGSFRVQTFNTSGSGTNQKFYFIAIGQRA